MITIAEQTGGIYSHIYRANEFKNLFEDLYRRLKSYFLIEYNPTEFGNHKIKMKICLPNETVQTTANFNNMPDIGAICLLNINFDFDKAIIKKESEEAIDNFYILMKAYPNMKIELRGHTDSLSRSNDPNLNLQLSQKRADAVKAALIKKGIDGQRISAVGYGDKIPIADNKTEEGRALNRRTEFIILSNKK